MKMNGSVEDEEEKKESNNSPGKKNAGAVQAESFTMTKEKVLTYARDIIKSIKERIDQMDDPNHSHLAFGVEQILLSPTVQASFDMYGNASGNSTKGKELYLAQVNLQDEIEKNCKVAPQFCTQESKPEEMTVVEAKITNYPSIND